MISTQRSVSLHSTAGAFLTCMNSRKMKRTFTSASRIAIVVTTELARNAP